MNEITQSYIDEILRVKNQEIQKLKSKIDYMNVINKSLSEQNSNIMRHTYKSEEIIAKESIIEKLQDRLILKSKEIDESECKKIKQDLRYYEHKTEQLTNLILKLRKDIEDEVGKT